jgi:hypothetical protein
MSGHSRLREICKLRGVDPHCLLYQVALVLYRAVDPVS